MKVIGIDARMVGTVPSGLGTYAAQLAKHLPPLDPGNSYVIIRRPGSPGPLASGSNVREVFVEGDLDQPTTHFVKRPGLPSASSAGAPSVDRKPINTAPA